MKIWNTKYALTAGITVHGAVYVGDGMVDVGHGLYLHGEGKEWHCTRTAAIARAQGMRKAKIVSLKKAITKMEKLTFVNTPE